MDISVLLAKVLGPYFLILGISMFINVARVKSVVEDLSDNTPLLFFSGSIALIFGTLIVVVNNIWSADWRIVVTLVGWIILVKGVMRVLFPQMVLNAARNVVQSNMAYYITTSVVTLIGLFLSYCGYM